ncbi:MAG: hypothetical protein Q4G16_00765 [Cruoricaptor ignavus]|nr:hypothetical protein [Cruoricaptor ignavus]
MSPNWHKHLARTSPTKIQKFSTAPELHFLQILFSRPLPIFARQNANAVPQHLKTVIFGLISVSLPMRFYVLLHYEKTAIKK